MTWYEPYRGPVRLVYRVGPARFPIESAVKLHKDRTPLSWLPSQLMWLALRNTSTITPVFLLERERPLDALRIPIALIVLCTMLRTICTSLHTSTKTKECHWIVFCAHGCICTQNFIQVYSALWYSINVLFRFTRCLCISGGRVWGSPHKSLRAGDHWKASSQQDTAADTWTAIQEILPGNAFAGFSNQVGPGIRGMHYEKTKAAADLSKRQPFKPHTLSRILDFLIPTPVTRDS